VTIAVLVPALNRPGNAGPLVRSLRENTRSDYRCLFICSPGDTAEHDAADAAGAEVLVVDWQPGYGDFARKINHGYTVTKEPWVFQAADDLRFHPGWDTEAIAIAERLNAGVVGTQDLGNAQVRRGQHSTHTLFARRYLDEQGGTIDNTGSVFCELYRHQFVDNEAVETAKLRGEFAFARRSTVEHLHPLWRKAEMDDTYRKALADFDHDRALFMQRMRMIRTRLARRRNR